MERLRSLSTSPLAPEPPRESRFVNAAMTAAQRLGFVFISPHCSGQSDDAKLEWEYAATDEFWRAFGGQATMDVLDGKDVLDVGCGWGGKAIFVAQRTRLRSIHGFDLPYASEDGRTRKESAELEARARGVTNATFSEGYGESIPFGEAQFDVVIVDNVLEHVEDPDRVISECHRVLRRGGLLLALFPSIRMLRAHHLDRAVSIPGIHYVASMRTWAAGLNHYLLYRHRGAPFHPFSIVGRTKYHRELMLDLNGLDLAAFKRLVARVGFTTRHLELVPIPGVETKGGPLMRATYRLARSLPPLREPLSDAIAYVGEK